MARAKRRCTAKATAQQEKHFPNPLDAAATDSDRAKWQGFCQIESEPAIFNTILSKWGVEGVRTREVMCLDEATLRGLPQPVYGIIFLFRYNNLDAGSTDQPPDAQDVWFATQNMDNMCGTLALLNMVMNIKDAGLGDSLMRFREATMHMSPVEKGNAVADFSFIRRVHNSWAKKSDMLSQDLKLQDTFRKAQQRTSRKRKRLEEEEEEAAYHFTAYLPIGDQVWKLDGMDGLPQQFKLPDDANVGWLQQVARVLSDRMALLIGEGIHFNVLAMTKDPLLIAKERLLTNFEDLHALEVTLEQESIEQASMEQASTERKDPDRDRSHEPEDASAELSPDGGPVQLISNGNPANDEPDVEGHTDLTVDHFDGSTSSELAPEEKNHLHTLLDLSKSPMRVKTRAWSLDKSPSLIGEAGLSPIAEQRKLLFSEQVSLYRAYVEEEAEVKAEAERAKARRWDYGPVISRWLSCLAQRDDPKTGRAVLETLIDEVQGQSGG